MMLVDRLDRRGDGLRRLRRAARGIYRQDRLQPLRRHDALQSGFPPDADQKSDDTPDTRWGIFGRVNVSTKFGEIRDGLEHHYDR